MTSLKLTAEKVEALRSLAKENGWKLNEYYLQTQAAVIFQIPGEPSARLIYRPMEAGRRRQEVRNRSDWNLIQIVAAILA